MKRTVFYVSKNITPNTFQEQPDKLFPFLNSPIVQKHSKQFIKFKKVHALCNLQNISTVVPIADSPYEFIFFGRSNVGKSSLLNSLLQKPIAATSKQPGKTKQLLFCELQSQIKSYLVDAPGYGYATGVSKKQIGQWGKLISTYLTRTKQNTIRQTILCLLDVEMELKETDVLVFNMLENMKKNFQVVFTKCDKMDNSDFERGMKIAQLLQQKYTQSMNFYIHFTSSKNNSGIDDLRNHLMFKCATHLLV